MDDPGKTLLIEEFKACRSLIEKNIDIIEKNEVYALGAAGALFVFSISSTSREVALASAWTPLIIGVVGWLRFIGLDRTIDITNEYCISLEEKFPDTLHWASFYKRRNKERGKRLKMSRIALWMIFKSACLVFAVYMTMKAPLSPESPTPSPASVTVPVKP